MIMSKFLKAILLIITVIATTNVNAQTDTSQNLNKRQQAIISIAAVTARGDLQKLKPKLNAGL